MSDTKETIRMISVADTVHDFGDLHENRYYKNFLDRTKDYMTALSKTVTKTTVEEVILKRLNIYDKDEMYDTVSFSELNDKHIKRVFSIITDNVDDIIFKYLLGSISISHNGFKGSRIDYVADVNLLSNKTICSIEINQGPEKKVKGSYVISGSTYYDRGTNIAEEECGNKKSVNVELGSEHGNLFGLNFIRIVSENKNDFIKYQYDDSNNNKVDVSIGMEEYIERQGDSSTRGISFFRNLILGLKNGKGIIGGGIKRKANNEEMPENKKRKTNLSLTDLLELLNYVYNLDYKKFFKIEKGKITDPFYIDKFVKILFDFKRAGDQLQVITAINNKSVFVSNDRLSVAFACAKGIPCIKTAIDGAKEDNKSRRRKITFYNFDKDMVMKNVFQNESYYKNACRQIIDLISKTVPFIKDGFGATMKTRLLKRIEEYQNVIDINPIPRISDTRYEVKIKYIYVFNAIIAIIKIVYIYLSVLSEKEKTIRKIHEYQMTYDRTNNDDMKGLLSILSKDPQIKILLFLKIKENKKFYTHILDFLKEDVEPDRDLKNYIIYMPTRKNKGDSVNDLITKFDGQVDNPLISAYIDNVIHFKSTAKTVNIYKVSKHFDEIDNEVKNVDVIETLAGADYYDNTLNELVDDNMFIFDYYDSITKTPMLGGKSSTLSIIHKKKHNTKTQFNLVKDKLPKIKKVQDTYLDVFTKNMEEEYKEPTPENDMVKLLAMFFVKHFNMFDNHGNITASFAHTTKRQSPHFSMQ